jgi:hypothetical protein
VEVKMKRIVAEDISSYVGCRGFVGERRQGEEGLYSASDPVLANDLQSILSASGLHESSINIIAAANISNMIRKMRVSEK